MLDTLDPFRFLLFAVAGWTNQKQQQAIEHLREENRVLRAQLGGRRLRSEREDRRKDTETDTHYEAPHRSEYQFSPIWAALCKLAVVACDLFTEML